MANEELPRSGPASRLVIRVARVAGVRLRGGIPEVATCADVQRNRRKLREVARAVHQELVGMEESIRRVNGSDEGILPSDVWGHFLHIQRQEGLRELPVGAAVECDSMCSTSRTFPGSSWPQMCADATRAW